MAVEPGGATNRESMHHTFGCAILYAQRQKVSLRALTRAGNDADLAARHDFSAVPVPDLHQNVVDAGLES
jgi:hypothetical protein